MISIIADFFIIVRLLIQLAFYCVFVSCQSLFRVLVPLRLKSLDNEFILVTGAANGIGKAICLEIAKVSNGKAKLVCWDINKKQLDSLIEELTEKGGNAFPYVVDVSNREQVLATSNAVKLGVGSVTVIINNAGLMPCIRLLDHSAENIEKTIQVNVLAHFWIIKEFLPEMIKRNSGHIVAIASAGALVAFRNLVVYHSSKFAVNGYMEALEDELQEYLPQCNIKLSTVYPTWVNTSFAQNTIQSRLRWLTTFLETSYVAEMVVSGMRQNYPHIYVPYYVSSFSWMSITPYKIQLAVKKLLSIDMIPPTLQNL